MSQTVHTQLLKSGLVQFGRFQLNGEVQPMTLRLDLLPSYPSLLRRLVELAQPFIPNTRYDRILSTPEAIPFGTSLSVTSQIPLVYSQGSNLLPVHDLVGAYDVGHPAILVTNVLRNDTKFAQLIERAGRVGLNVERVLAVLGDDHRPTKLDAVTLINLPDLLTDLVGQGIVPKKQAEAVQAWLNGR
jgi:hypothetical protein